MRLLVLAINRCDGQPRPTVLLSFVRHSAVPPAAPAVPPGGKTQLLEAGTALLQKKTPVGELNVCVNGFHFNDGDLGMQMEAHHCCGIVAPDVRPGADAWEPGETLQLALERVQPGTAAVGHGLPEDAASDGSAAAARP